MTLCAILYFPCYRFCTVYDTPGAKNAEEKNQQFYYYWPKPTVEKNKRRERKNK